MRQRVKVLLLIQVISHLSLASRLFVFPVSGPINGGVDGDINQPRLKDDTGEGADFKVPSAGYYRIDLDCYTNTLTFTALDKDPAEYQQMMIAGDFTNWGMELCTCLR